jgi:hypothetical protein
MAVVLKLVIKDVHLTNAILISEIHTGLKMKAAVVWIVTLFNPVGSYEHFGQTHCFHLQNILIP